MFILTVGQYNYFFSLAMLPAIHPSLFWEGTIGVGGWMSGDLFGYCWLTLEVTAVDVCFVAWKLAMSRAKDFFSLACRIAISPAMNPSLLVVNGEGTGKGRVGVGWSTILKVAAEGMGIFDSFFSLVQKISISLAINFSHCSIVIVSILDSGVHTGGGLSIFFLVFASHHCHCRQYKYSQVGRARNS